MDFRSKIGPLPAWAWGTIIGGVFVVWLWVSKRDTTASDAEPTSQSTSPVAVTSDLGTPVYVTPPADTTATATADPTNSEWLVQAVNAVANNSTTSRLTAQSVLEKYLYGDSALSASDQIIVNLALTKVGLPPEGTFSTPSLQSSTTTPIATTTKPGKTAAQIAAEKAAAAKAAADAKAKADAAAAKNKRRALSSTDQIVKIDDLHTFYRIEYDGSVTPIKSSTYSAYRLRKGKPAVKVDAATWANVQRATKNPSL